MKIEEGREGFHLLFQSQALKYVKNYSSSGFDKKIAATTKITDVITI